MAVLIFPLAVAWGLLEIPDKEKRQESVFSETGMPGGAKAVLYMADGAVVDLNDSGDFSLQEKTEHKFVKIRPVCRIAGIQCPVFRRLQYSIG